MGMTLVDRRIKIRYGQGFGIKVECDPERWTRVTIALPGAEEMAIC